MAFPGFYSDFGKKARDLLTKDFQYDKKIAIETTTASNLGFSGTYIVKADNSLAVDLKTILKYNNAKLEAKTDTNSNVILNATLDSLAPGIKVLLSGALPDFNKSGKVELQYLRDYAAMTGSIGLSGAPKVDVTAAFGQPSFAVGGAASVDTSSGELTKYEGGIQHSTAEYAVTAVVADKADTLKLSYVHALDKDRLVGADVMRSLSKATTTIAAGGSYRHDPYTVYKARIDSTGTISALLQHQLRPDATVTFTTQWDSTKQEKNSKFGVALTLMPPVYTYAKTY
eukprot:jgi/Chlat1/5289/Chrsp35S05247